MTGQQCSPWCWSALRDWSGSYHVLHPSHIWFDFPHDTFEPTALHTVHLRLWSPTHHSITIVKFADDTTVMSFLVGVILPKGTKWCGRQVGAGTTTCYWTQPKPRRLLWISEKRKQTLNHFTSMVLVFHFLGVHITRTCPGVWTEGSWQRRLSRDFISCESSGKITSLKSCCCPTINVLSKAFYATACVLLPSLDKLQSSRRHRKAGNTIKDKINKQCPNSSCTTISNNLISLWKHVSNKSCRKPPILDILPLKYYLKLSTRLSLSSGINAPLSPRTDWIEQICTYEWLKQHCVAMHCSKHILCFKYKAFSFSTLLYNLMQWCEEKKKKNTAKIQHS